MNFDENGNYLEIRRDPEEIPRCKECKHWEKNDELNKNVHIVTGVWGKCDAFGGNDIRHELTTCYRWERREVQ